MSEFDNMPDLYTLVDEEGNEQTFELLDVVEVDEQKYFALIPAEEDDMIEGDGELVILKSDTVDGEEILVSIDDDNEFEKIGQIFLNRIQDAFECDDDCCGGGCDCGHEH